MEDIEGILNCGFKSWWSLYNLERVDWSRTCYLSTGDGDEREVMSLLVTANLYYLQLLAQESLGVYSEFGG